MADQVAFTWVYVRYGALSALGVYAISVVFGKSHSLWEWYYAPVALAVGVAVAVSMWQTDKRHAQWRATAATLGLDWSGSAPSPEDLPLLRAGHRGSFGDVAQGSWQGIGVLVGDYSYLTGSGKSEKSHPFLVACTNTGLDAATITIAPRGLVDRAEDALGHGGIQTESQEFDDAYELKCEDKEFALKVVAEGFLSTLVDLIGQKPRVELEGGRLLCAVAQRSNDELGVGVKELLGHLRDLRGRIPTIAARDYPPSPVPTSVRSAIERRDPEVPEKDPAP